MGSSTVARVRLRELAARALDARARLGRGVSIGISGVDCAGKSTVAAAVREILRDEGCPVVLVPGDEFTRPTAERYAEPDEGLGYYRDSFDYSAVFERILPAVRDSYVGTLTVRVSDWEHDGWRDHVLTLDPGAIVIVEGVFLFADGRAGAFDVSVWLDLPLDRVVERALERPRDLERMGGPDGVRRRYVRRYVPGQELHLERDAPRTQVDLVVPSPGA